MASMNNPKSVNRIVAQQAKPAVHEHALRIGVKAEGLLGAHHKRGRHSIHVDEGRRTDAFVSMVGPGAVSLELGHFAGYKGKRTHVPGLAIVRRAAGLRP